VEELKNTFQSIETSNKPKGIYIFGKHISGWYFFPFMALLFIFLWFFASGYFEMKEEANLANVKLQVIRDDFSHYPTIKHVFEMLDSTCVNFYSVNINMKGTASHLLEFLEGARKRFIRNWGRRL